MCEHKIYQVNKAYRALVWMIVVLLQTCVSTPMFLFVGVFLTLRAPPKQGRPIYLPRYW